MVESKELKLLKSRYYTPLQYNIIQLLKKNVTMTRDDICRALGFGKHAVTYVHAYPQKRQRKRSYHVNMEQYDRRTTIYDNLKKLLDKGVVEKFSYNTGERGRPPIFWQLRDDGGND